MSEKKKSKVIKRLSASAFLLLVLYVLSIGPVFAFFTPRVSNNSGFHSFYRAIYAPLYWGARNNRFVSTQLTRYILLCEYYINPPPENLRPRLPR